MSKKSKLSPYKIAKTLDGYSESDYPAIPTAIQNSKNHVETREERERRLKQQHTNNSKNRNKLGSTEHVDMREEEFPKKQKRRARK